MKPGRARAVPSLWSATIFVVALAAGIALRIEVFEVPHLEGDERLYAALVDQLRSGQGYTLHGHPILSEPWVIREQYDTPLFYHPPAGIVWFAPFVALFGNRGLDVAQLAAFAVFLAGTMLLAREVVQEWTPGTAGAVALVSAATPIVVHVSIHRWLDGPQVAAAAVAAWLLVRAAKIGTPSAAILAGLGWGATCLVKLNAVLALPGAAALAWVAAEDGEPRRKLRALLVTAGVAGAAVLPWLIAEHTTFGTIFPVWAGKPAARLVAENPFVRHVTLVRTPWAYFRLLPQTEFTLVPSLAILAIARPAGRAGRVAAALVLWAGLIVGANVALGAIGYSKLLRYVVLIEPATVLLPMLALRSARSWRDDGRRAAASIATAALGVACGLEVAQAVQIAYVYPQGAWIRPLLGRAW